MGKRVLLFCLLWILTGSRVLASETEVTDSFLEEIPLQELDESLEKLGGEIPFSFSEAVGKLIRGEIPLTFENMGQLIKEGLFAQMGNARETVIQILLLVTVAAVFSNFANAFEKSQVAEISFYMMYLLLFTLLMKGFWSLHQLTAETLEQIIAFMKLLVPSYFLASVFASGAISGWAYYELTLVLLLVLQWLLKYLILPAVSVYVLFLLVNQLTKEDYFSRIAELLQTFVGWTLKTLTAVAVGAQTVQCLILPAVDSLKTTVVNKSAGAVPGIGNLFSGVTEMVIGSAVLLKNAVGVAGLLVLIMLCLIPFLQLGFCTLLYKLLAAVVQPVSDKRMVECIGSVGEGAAMLVRVLLTVGVLFFLSMAMAVATIGGT